MQCQEIKELMVTVLYEDELGAEEQRQLEAHLSACAACRQEMSAFATTRQALRQWDVESSPGTLVDVAVISTAGWSGRLGAWLRGWLWPAMRMSYQGALALLVLLGFLAVLNTEITWDGSKLAFRPRLPWTESAPTEVAAIKKEKFVPSGSNSNNEARPVAERGLGDEEIMQWLEGRIMESQRSTVLQVLNLMENQDRVQGLETYRKVAALERKFGQLSKRVGGQTDTGDRKLNTDKN